MMVWTTKTACRRQSYDFCIAGGNSAAECQGIHLWVEAQQRLDLLKTF